MFDLKIPEHLPFKQSIVLAAVWGASIGFSLGVAMTITVLVAAAFHILPK